MTPLGHASLLDQLSSLWVAPGSQIGDHLRDPNQAPLANHRNHLVHLVLFKWMGPTPLVFLSRNLGHVKWTWASPWIRMDKPLGMRGCSTWILRSTLRRDRFMSFLPSKSQELPTSIESTSSFHMIQHVQTPATTITTAKVSEGLS